MKSPRSKKPIGIALDPKLLDQVEAWRLAQVVRPSKTAIYETALREFLASRNLDRNEVTFRRKK